MHKLVNVLLCENVIMNYTLCLLIKFSSNTKTYFFNANKIIIFLFLFLFFVLFNDENYSDQNLIFFDKTLPLFYIMKLNQTEQGKVKTRQERINNEKHFFPCSRENCES